MRAGGTETHEQLTGRHSLRNAYLYDSEGVDGIIEPFHECGEGRRKLEESARHRRERTVASSPQRDGWLIDITIIRRRGSR